MKDQLIAALEKFQEDGPYTLGSHHPPEYVVREIVDDMGFDGLFDMDDRDILVETVFQGREAALVKVNEDDGEGSPVGEAVYLSVNDEENQAPDEYGVTVWVEDDPTKWLGQYYAARLEQITCLSAEADRINALSASLRKELCK